MGGRRGLDGAVTGRVGIEGLMKFLLDKVGGGCKEEEVHCN